MHAEFCQFRFARWTVQQAEGFEACARVDRARALLARHILKAKGSTEKAAKAIDREISMFLLWQWVGVYVGQKRAQSNHF